MLPERLKELRLEAGLTQKELALAINTSQQNVGLYELGKRNPKKEILDNLSEFFNVSTKYLEGKTDIRNPEEEIDLSDFEILYRNTSKGLSDDEQAQLEIDLKNFLIERQKVIQERQKAKASDKLS